MQVQWYYQPRRARRTRTSSPLVGALVFLGVGVLLLGIGGYFLYDTLTFLNHATARATATVITCPMDYSADDSNGSCPPTFRFPANGGLVTVTDPVEGDYHLNEQLQVAYDPANPQGARIVSFMHFWFLPTQLGGLGALFLLIGAGYGGVLLFRIAQGRLAPPKVLWRANTRPKP